MWIPDDAEIRALHERFAPSAAALELVWTHCEIVGRIAGQFRPPGVDSALVRAGCLLHDLGVYRLYGPSGELDHAGYLRHGVLGHELLSGLGFAEELCRFCSCHTGVGLTRADIEEQGLPLPPGDYLPRTPSEELVMYADKFHSKEMPPVFVSAAAYRRSIARFGADKLSRFTALVDEYGEPDLTALSAEYGHAIV